MHILQETVFVKVFFTDGRPPIEFPMVGQEEIHIYGCVLRREFGQHEIMNGPYCIPITMRMWPESSNQFTDKSLHMRRKHIIAINGEGVKTAGGTVIKIVSEGGSS